MSTNTEKVLIAMSGGVDSSTAAAVLLEQGRNVVGVTLRIPRYGPEDGRERSCCGQKGMDDARRVAEKLGIPFYALDYREKFERTVLENFRQEYLSGRTPNPCVRCNDWLKFGFLQETALALGAGAIATGHYVRCRHNPQTGRWELLRGSADDDQSYFLFPLSQEQLALARFPLGEMTKEQVREKASSLDLPVHDKPGSTDLCFLPAGGYREVLRAQAPELFEPGPIVHVSGEKLGRHEGIACYTLGQRRGLGISWSEPLYVVELDPEENRVVVGEKQHVFRGEMEVAELNWVALPGLETARRAEVQIRFMHPAAPAVIQRVAENHVRVQFEEPQSAPTPGQAAVFYEADRVLGGGFIT